MLNLSRSDPVSLVDPHHREEARRGLVNGLYGQFPQDLLFLALYPLALLYATRDLPRFELTLAWSLAVYFLCALRIYLHVEFRRGSKLFSTPENWGNAFTCVAGLTGFLIGFSIVILLDLRIPGAFVFAVLFIVGVVSASLNHYAHWLPAQAALTFLATAVPALRLLFENGWLPHVMSALLLAFFVSTLLFAHQRNRQVVNQLLLRIENRELINKLTLERNRASEADRSKTHFLAAASHDLRQPIHSINLFLESLRAARDERERQATVDKLSRATQSLGTLLDSLLDISKLDADALSVNFRAVTLRSVVHPVAERFRSELPGHGLELRVGDLGQTVRTDPELLARVVSNLVSNAVKFTDEGSITIDAEDNERSVNLVVRDTGCGIEAGNLEHVFDEFFQESNPARDRFRGIGLGLSICRRICRLLDHGLGIDSIAGRGTTATVSLARAEADEETRSAASAPRPDPGQTLSGLKVLVVEDDGMVAEAMLEMLERWGCEARVEEDAERAIASVERGEFDPAVAIADLRLPGRLDGIGLIRHFETHGAAHVRAIIVTGDTAPGRIARGHATDIPILYKPIQPARLRALLERLAGDG